MRRESYQPLKIDSLGRKTEILVLKDIPSADGYKTDPPPTVPGYTNKVSTTDIEAMMHDQEPSKPAEIFNAIGELRPAEDIIPRRAFDAIIKRLVKSFSPKQLGAFVKAELSRVPAPQPVKQAQASTTPALRAKLDPIANVKRSPWRPDEISHVDESGQNESKTQSASELKSSRKKDRNAWRTQSAEKILRLVWKVQVEEEANVPGRISLSLNPEQWGLLQTKNAGELFSVLRSGRYYRNTQLVRTPNDALCILGPQSEAEGIADLIESAFHNAKTVLINVAPLDSDRLLALGVAQNIRDVMGASRTYITMVRNNTALAIYAFNHSSRDKALRWILALLQRPQQPDASITIHDAQDCIDAPIHYRTILPSSSRLDKLVRKTVPQAAPTDSPSVSHLGSGERVYKDVLKALRNCRSRPTKMGLGADRGIDASSHNYWQSAETLAPWKATFGYLLHRPSATAALEHRSPDNPSKVQATSEPSGWTTFAPQTPNLAKLLPSLLRTPDSARSLFQLRVKLVPAPLPGADSTVRLRSNLPHIELLFPLHGVGRSERSSSSEYYDLLEGFHLDDMRIVRQQDIVDLSCAAHVRDARFSRRRTLNADVGKIMDDPDPSLRDFINAVAESAKGASQLYAPASVKIRPPPIPGQRQDEHVEYLFAGFEYRETRLFSPDPERLALDMWDDGCVVKLADVKTDASGASRSEMSITCQEGRDMDPERLVKSAFGMLQFVDEVHRRDVPAPREAETRYPGGQPGAEGEQSEKL